MRPREELLEGDVPCDFECSALQWQAQGVYREPHAPYQRWRAGALDGSEMQAYLTPSRAVTSEGKRVQRLAAFADPLTEYQRYQCTVAPTHQAAGEELGWITEHAALRLGMPDHDYWLLDDAKVLRLIYEQHVLVGVQMIIEASLVQWYRGLSALAWQQANPPPVDVSTVS